MINIRVFTPTKSAFLDGVLHLSGLIEYVDGSFSHIINEKNFNKLIEKIKEEPVEKLEVVEPLVQKVETTKKVSKKIK
jgi:hypothetical protein